DSAGMTFDHWVHLAKQIEENYQRHAGFVILHGTDTLAYTASALAFLLEGLAKPVVLTGSQRPIGQTRSDAAQNLVTAIEIASAALWGGTVVPEVGVFFRDHLLRGCRTTKISASSFDAFDSPNFPALGTAGETLSIDASRLRAPGGPLKVHDRLESRIAVLDVFPGMSPALLEALLSSGELRGVVLKTFGSGNVPATPGFLAAIAQAVERGVVVLNVTQCRSGEVSLGLYESSADLLARGVVGGMDLTPEAALAKLSFILGLEPDPARAADLLRRDWRGEQIIRPGAS
ncbi:MAG: asparaginase, partial [Cyanobacteria bacterium REEB65]|nr:asparaginase [Cyanobacteria bacterium REEB65]